MKKITMQKIKYFLLILLLPLMSCAQFNMKGVLDEAKKATSQHKGLSNEDIVSGLKEALSVGTNNSTASASKVDGYLKNANIKIPFPAEAEKMEKTLRSIGMNQQVDEFVTSMNRAAEEA